MKRGFNLLMAIFMLLLLSGLAVLTMKYVSIHVNHFVDSYNKEQAGLFMDSVIEATLLKIEGNERHGCDDFIRRLNFVSPDKKFEANVSILRYYLFNGRDNSGNELANCDIIYPIHTRDSHGYVWMEVIVHSTKSAKIKNPIRITKRTLQRP